MTKRLLSLALSLAMLLTMTPLVVGAEESAAKVTIAFTDLESGKYYVPAENPNQVIATTETPGSDYLTFDNNTLTVHGNVSLTSGRTNVMTVSDGALTITGEEGSSLSLTHGTGYALVISRGASVRLTGDVDFTATSGNSYKTIQLDGDLTTESYSGNFTCTNTVTSSMNAGAVIGYGKISIVTTGNIAISCAATDTYNSVVSASELTLQGKSVTVTGSATLLSSGTDLNVTATEGSLSFASTSETQCVLSSNNTTTLSAPEEITVTSAANNIAIGGLKLILNTAQKATLTCTGSGQLMSSVQDQIESHVGTLVITQNGKTTVTKGDKTYDGDITTAGLDYTTGLPTKQATYLAGEGTAEFTPGEVPTLTLKDATAGNINLGDNSFNIVVEGENTIGRVEATYEKNAKISVTGDGSLKAATLRAGTNGELIVDIKGELELNDSKIAMTNSKATISAKSIKVKGPYGFQQTATVPVSLTATDGDIEFDGISNSSFTFSNIQLTLKAPNGNVISKNAPFSCPVDILAKGDISIAGQSYGAGVMQNTTKISSETGNIDVNCEGEYAAAINIRDSGKDVVLSAPNGKVTVSSSEGAILNTFNNSPSGSVAIHAKEVEISSSPSKAYSTIKTAQLTIDNGDGANCDKVTIIGRGKSAYSSNSNSCSVLYASGEIKSNDLLIKASAQDGYATGEGTIALRGTGKVIGNVGDGTTHDSTVEILGASAGELTNVAFHNAKEKTLFTSGDGYVVYDPSERTLLLQDAVINDSIDLDEGSEIKVTINGSLTINDWKHLQLCNAKSVTVEPNVPISIGGPKASLTLPDSTTAAELNALNLSGTGSVGYGDNKYGTLITLSYELDGGENASANPTTYIGFTADKAPEGYYPIALAAPTKEGYTFQGWYSDAAYTTKVEEIKDNTVTALYAKWEKQAQNNGGSSGGSSSSSSNAVTPPGKTENGTVSVGTKNAKKGDTVTITVTPDSGYQVGQVTVKDASGNTVAVKDLGGGKYSFVMPAAKVSVDVSFVEAAAPGADFADVAADAWYKGAVDYVVQKGLMTGTGEKAFSPEAPMTRAMLMTVLARYAGEDTSGGATWYEKGMAWAVANGVSDGSNPAGNITREQLVTMLYRYVGSPKTSGSLAVFADADAVSAYAVQAMQWAVKQGIITGTTATTITPQGNATRAQVATILMRFCQGRDA